MHPMSTMLIFLKDLLVIDWPFYLTKSLRVFFLVESRHISFRVTQPMIIICLVSNFFIKRRKMHL